MKSALVRSALLAVPFLALADTFTYTKSFPGSVPEYFQLGISQAGDLDYQEAKPGDEGAPPPLKAHLSAAESSALFNLVRQIDWKQPLESGLKVANTGKKTFRFSSDNPPQVREQTFNYSEILPAQQLLVRLEEIVATERAYIELERSVHFDKLGINDALAQIESLWLHKQLACPAQFIPLLAKIASRPSFMHLVRDRAAKLKDDFAKAGSVPAVASAN